MSTRREELEASWARTRGYLEKAFAQLPASPAEGEEGGSVREYREWLDCNELELALEELELLGEANPVGGRFWVFLLRAAAEMKLDGRAGRYREIIKSKGPIESDLVGSDPVDQ